MKQKFLSLFTAFAMLMSLFGAIPITAGAAVSSAVTTLTAQWEEPHTHPICGASSCTHEGEHTAVEWTPLTQAMIDSVSTQDYYMTSGSYYLAEDITTEKGITIGEKTTSNINVNICFNGHTITCSNNRENRTSQIYVNKNSSLTLCDCQGSGGFHSAENVTRPLFWTDGSLNLYGGTLSGKSGTVYGADSSLNLYGGTLSNTTNTVHGSFTLDGAALETTSYAINAQAGSTVRIKSGSVASAGSVSVLVYTTDFAMEGGNITNTKTTLSPYAIEFTSTGGGTISGGVIKAEWTGGSGINVVGPNPVVLSGNPTIEGPKADIRIGASGKLTVGDNLEGQYSVAYSSPTKITEDAPYSFTTDDNKDNSAHFKDSALTSSGLALRNIGEGSEQTVQIYRPHLLTAHEAKTPTCTETGNSAYWECTNTGCGKLFSDADGKTEIDNIPTISATDHNMTHHEAVAATCTTAGNSEYWTCGNCNKMFSDENGETEISEIPTIEAKEHSLMYHAAVEPECVKAGNSEYWTCSVCNKIFSDANGETEISSIPVIPGRGHRSDSGTVTTEPTCTEKGTKTYKCTVCGETLRTEDIDATDHSWGDWTITAEPTFTATGTAERICAKNNEHKDTFTLPDLTDTTVWTEGTRVEPTEYTDGLQEYTSDYGTVIVTIPALGHTHEWGDWTITAEPTLTATGTAERICAKNNEHKDTFTLPDLTDTSVWTEGTRIEPTEYTDGSQEYTSDYGTVTVIIPALGHTHEWGDWTITTEPTLTATGTAERICAKNNEHKDTFTLPVLTDTFVWTEGTRIEPTEDTDGSQEYTSDYGTVTVIIPATGQSQEADSEIIIKDGAPNIAVEGLDELAAETDPTASKIKVTMTVESKEEDSTNAEHSAIKAISASVKIDYLDISLTKTVDTVESGISETAKALKIIIPFNMTGKKNIKVYRYHGSSAELLSDNTANDEYYVVGDRVITVYAKKFSTYAIGYDTENAEPTPTTKPSSSGSISRYKVTFDAGENGKITKGNASVNVLRNSKINDTSIPTVTANEGYTFIGWSTDGKTTVDPTAAAITKATTFTALYEAEAEETPAEPTQKPTPEAKQHKAYIVGYEGKFIPDGNITRAETAAILARLTDGFEENESYKTSFADVDNELWYCRYIGFEENQNIITGYEDGTFKPEESITRAEFANMITRFAELSGNPGDTPFTDISGHWAAEQIAACYEAGYIKGYEDNTFLPDNNITRAEAVSIINRVLDRNDIKDFTNPFIDVTESHWAYADIMEAAVTHNAADN